MTKVVVKTNNTKENVVEWFYMLECNVEETTSNERFSMSSKYVLVNKKNICKYYDDDDDEDDDDDDDRRKRGRREQRVEL